MLESVEANAKVGVGVVLRLRASYERRADRCCEDVVIASVGPVMTAALEAMDSRPTLSRFTRRWAPLIRAASDSSADLLARKRGGRR
jgi:hypothetical protein